MRRNNPLFYFVLSGGRLSTVCGHCGSEQGAHGDPAREGEPDQISQVHDPHGCVFSTLSDPLGGRAWVLPVRTHLQEHLGDDVDGGELQALPHPLPLQGGA